MDLNNILSQLETASEEDIEKLLQQYNVENTQTFTFDPKEETLRSKLCHGVLTVLGRQVQPSCQKTCLETLRILSRDKRVLAPVATKEGMLTLAGMAKLQAGEEQDADKKSSQEQTLSEENKRVVVEALKCLCNVVYNSPAAQQVCVDVQLVRGLCASLATARTWSHEVGLFTLRLLFLLSALQPAVRGLLRREWHAVRLLTEVLEHTLDVRWVGPYEAARPDPQAVPMPAENNERAMEALKAMFNLTLSETGGEEDDHQLRLIAAILRHLLMLKTETEEKTEEAHSHAVNLLNNLPVSYLDVLIDVPVQGGQEKYAGKNMDAIEVLLDFMEKRIDKGSNYKEGLTPVLSLLTEGSRHHREIRRYIKAQLPLVEFTLQLYIQRSHLFLFFSINPITGHVEEPMPNPVEEMTEEQKEYEAEKLANMFDKLSR
ncbi:synembryn-B [Neolamprologus brichardi]|uniref:synembryn-B n=1 Tax=Neolamprologus brichardi TaxID=32507 RepID=UPI001643DEC9|nr:synembryn-B [Neolamprologus brichardi]